MRNNFVIHYELIKEAVNGNVEVINLIKEYYYPYLSKLSLRPMIDDSGNSHLVVDEELRGNLENKLIETILTFRME